MMIMSLYDQIGKDFIENAIELFYQRVFTDSMIGYFFAQSDQSVLTKHQIDFVTAMLGGPKKYIGSNIKSIHQPLKIRPAHFSRRQMILKEVLDELGLKHELSARWITMEEKLRASIVRGPGCQH